MNTSCTNCTGASPLSVAYKSPSLNSRTTDVKKTSETGTYDKVIDGLTQITPELTQLSDIGKLPEKIQEKAIDYLVNNLDTGLNNVDTKGDDETAKFIQGQQDFAKEDLKARIKEYIAPRPAVGLAKSTPPVESSVGKALTGLDKALQQKSQGGTQSSLLSPAPQPSEFSRVA